tara:strand:- start:701 stop:973 length:273 start_codon:yes stop_codon:yes gene_type:complete
MFKIIKNFFTFTKDSKMAETKTTDSRATKQLKKTITEQSGEISRLNFRVSELVDELFMIKNDVSAFKNAVSRDMQGLASEIQRHYNKENK